MNTRKANVAKSNTFTFYSALLVAEALQDKLIPFCKPHKCKIAGAIRRRQTLVSSVTIVCIPKKGQRTPAGELVPVTVNLLSDYISKHARKRNSKSKKGFRLVENGKRQITVRYMAMKCQIYMTTEEQFGRMMVLRTGPKSFTQKVAKRWCRLGYRGENGALVRQDQSQHKPPFPTEEAFFDFLEWDYIKPTHRG
jgi:DNA polymerase/3'-5' exonuclease PolX